MLDTHGQVRIEFAYPSDQKGAIPILVHRLLDNMFDIGRSHDFAVMLAGGTARRMALGINPVQNDTDLDIIISCSNASHVPTWKQSLALRTALKSLTGCSVDILNFDGNKWYPRYEKFKSSNPPSINRLLVYKEMRSNQWRIDDFRGGFYLAHVRERRIALCETRPGYFQCDLRDALNFMRLILEFPDLPVDSTSLARVNEFTRGGMFNSRNREISFVELMKAFCEPRQKTNPGMVNIPRNPFLSLFSLFIHASRIKQVIPLLEQMELKEAFEHFVDLKEAERIALGKRERGEPLSHIAFDRTFKIIPPVGARKSPWIGSFHSCSDFQDFVLAELREDWISHEALLTQYVRRFTADYLCDFIPNFNETVLVNRIAILNNTLSTFREYLLADNLTENWHHYIAHLLPEDIFEQIVQNETSIREGINEGRFLNFLDYFYHSEDANIVR